MILERSQPHGRERVSLPSSAAPSRFVLPYLGENGCVSALNCTPARLHARSAIVTTHRSMIAAMATWPFLFLDHPASTNLMTLRRDRRDHRGCCCVVLAAHCESSPCRHRLLSCTLALRSSKRGGWRRSLPRAHAPRKQSHARRRGWACGLRGTLARGRQRVDDGVRACDAGLSLSREAAVRCPLARFDRPHREIE